MKGDIQNTHNKMENDPVAPHILEMLTPLGLIMNQGSAEAILRATSPIKDTMGTRKRYRESFGDLTVGYDFDCVINFAEERLVYVAETLRREKFTGVDNFSTIPNTALTPQNDEFRHMTVKNRRCQLIAMKTTSGIRTFTNQSAVKIAETVARLKTTLAHTDTVVAVEVCF